LEAIWDEVKAIYSVKLGRVRLSYRLEKNVYVSTSRDKSHTH